MVQTHVLVSALSVRMLALQCHKQVIQGVPVSEWYQKEKELKIQRIESQILACRQILDNLRKEA